MNYSASGRFHSDLHTHSTKSDGVLTPSELVAAAAEKNLDVLALTDHDTLAGLPEAARASERAGITFIPGVELSAEAGPHEIHILGYFVDTGNTTLVSTLAAHAHDREVRIERMVERLVKIGLKIDLEEVTLIAGEGTIGRPHIARALIKHGYADSISEAFDQYLGNGKPGFVPRTQSSPEVSVKLLRETGAIPVLAHPISSGDVEGTLRRLVPAGLLGLEVYYGEYDDQIRSKLRSISDRWGLVPTGGSDFHGIGFKEGRDLGEVDIPSEAVNQLFQLHEERRR